MKTSLAIAMLAVGALVGASAVAGVDCAADTRLLQELLDVGGEVRFPDGKYEISRSLVIGNNTALVCTSNVLVRLADGANCPLIVNRERQGAMAANIRIDGGTWDGNNVRQDRTKYSTGFPWMGGQAMAFAGVTNLVIRNLTIKDSNSFGIMLTDMRDFTVEDIIFDDNNRTLNEDGLHVNGYAYHGRIRNLRGHTNDDLVALNGDEGKFRSDDCTIRDVVIDGIDGGDDGWTAVRLLSRNAPVENVTIRNVRGKFKYNVVSFTHWAKADYRPGMGHFDNIVIEDIAASSARKTGTGHGGLIWFQEGVQDVGTVTIRNFRRVESADQRNQTCTVEVSDNVKIRMLQLENVTQQIPDNKPLVKISPKASVNLQPALVPYIASGELPGCISVFEKKGKREVCCLGFANVEKQIPMTMDSAFMQCSQTKGFCGVTMAILIEQGKVSLDDPVSKYLPEFKELWVEVSNTNGTRTLKRAKNVLKVRHVMTHTGGLPFEIPAKFGSVPGGGWTGGMPIRSVAATAAAMPLKFEPGTCELYSNTGIDIGAAIVEAVTNWRWQDFLQARVLGPLGMVDTTFKPTDAQLSRHVELYLVKGGMKARWLPEEQMAKRPYNDGHIFPSAGAGLWTTANDQLKFYRMLMNLGVGDNGVRILKEETVKNVLCSPQKPSGGYSLGLALWGDGWLGHGGAYGTSAAVNWKTKELKLWVVQQVSLGAKPWGKVLDDAANRFFAAGNEGRELEAWTGRTR